MRIAHRSLVRSTRWSVVVLPLASLALVSGGCGGLLADGDSANEAIDSLESLTSEGALLSLAVDDAPAGMTAEQVATQAAGSAGKRLTPAGCVVATATGASVTYKLTKCTGPYGLLQVSGTIKVDYTVAGAGLTAKASSTGLAVGGATLDLDATGVYSVSGATKKLVVTSTGQGQGARGTDFKRNGSYTATWDATCLSLDGTWSTTALARTWTTTVAGYKHCSGMCPAAGGVLTYTGGVSGTTVTVTFDGDNTAAWTSTKARTGAVAVSCGS